MFMKKTVTLLVAVLMVFASFLSFAGCGNHRGPGGGDKTKTQLNVFIYNGGYGTEWAAGVEERFEAKYANEHLEEGKTGVDVVFTPIKKNMSTNEIALGDYDVYFAENVYYDDLRSKGALLDISSIVTEQSSYDGKTIKSKLTAAQQEFFGVQENGQEHYYALPHYMGGSGLIYNKELFDEEGCYLIEGYQNNPALQYPKCFLGDWKESTISFTKTAGPDGISGNDDDGLPATYDEFYMLCNYISGELNQIPLTWNGYRYYNYTNQFIGALTAQNEGAENMLMNYTLCGSPTDLVKENEVPVNGIFNDSQMMESVTLSDNNESRKLLQRQVGKYYALSFMETIQKNLDSWTNSELVYDNGYSHTDAQSAFLRGGTSTDFPKTIAMLMDGVWGMNDAKGDFQEMERTMGEEYSMNNRDFGWMPLPRAIGSEGISRNVIVDNLRSLCMVSSKVPEFKKALALDFVQFCNSDAELVAYTQSTNTIKGLKYTLEENELSKLAPYGRSLYNFVQSTNTDVVYPCSHATTYVLNTSSFSEPNMYQATIGSTDYQFPMDAFKKGISAIDYFNALK